MKTIIVSSCLIIATGAWIAFNASPDSSPQPTPVSPQASAATSAPRSPAVAAGPFRPALPPPDSRPAAAPATKATADAARLRQAYSEMKRRKVADTDSDYKAFFDTLNPELAASVRALLISKSDVFDMLSDENERGTDRVTAAEKGKEFLRNVDQKLREQLGEEGFQALADYTKVMPYVKASERVADQMRLGSAELNPQQKSAVLQALIAMPKPAGTITDIVAGRVDKNDYLDSVESSNRLFRSQLAPVLTSTQQDILARHEADGLLLIRNRILALQVGMRDLASTSRK
jgi:hypothetical protein